MSYIIGFWVSGLGFRAYIAYISTFVTVFGTIVPGWIELVEWIRGPGDRGQGTGDRGHFDPFCRFLVICYEISTSG